VRDGHDHRLVGDEVDRIEISPSASTISVRRASPYFGADLLELAAITSISSFAVARIASR
jgi:hypothetical protein